MPRTPVITGVGFVTAVASTRREFELALTEHRSGIAACDDGPAPATAAIADFAIEDYLDNPKGYLDRGAELALAAAALALENAGLDLDTVERTRAGLAVGSAYGCLQTAGLFFRDFLTKGPRLVKPFIFPHAYPNTAASLLAIEHDLRGCHLHVASGGVASAEAVVAACDQVRLGRADVMLAGGFEALSDGLLTAASLAGRLAETCRPFDRDRQGAVPGEAGVMLVIEAREHAEQRGAALLAVPGATAASGGDGRTETGLTAAISRNVAASLVRHPADAFPDVILAAANGSLAGDRCELHALHRALPPEARTVPITSIKPLTGETWGAAGALQVAAALTLMDTGHVPPILNLEQPDTPTGLALVRQVGLQRKIRSAWVNTVDPGGAVVSIRLDHAPPA
jgi:3-oxoacyl-[acyl-carrier-protein] synthase II